VEPRKLTILAFGQAAQFCGGRHFDVMIKLPCSVADLRGAIAERFPLMQSNYMIAMNQTYANPNDLIEDPNVELALIPPVSGG
jgi:molybdopterin converting factor small subunit